MFTTFEGLISEIQRQTQQQAHITNAKVQRARYLMERKKDLLKKLAAIDDELEGIYQGEKDA